LGEAENFLAFGRLISGFFVRGVEVERGVHELGGKGHYHGPLRMVRRKVFRPDLSRAQKALA
jgi:hypothetical protein